MRLGGPVSANQLSASEWAAAVCARGYRAAYCPVGYDTDEALVRAYIEAADTADIVIAEVGAWSNPISPDAAERREAIAHCQRQLALAERIGARCCVNIAGSRNREQWDGPHSDNLTTETFDMIVETVREVIDAVRPMRTFYTLETMPWIVPVTPADYLALIRAIGRPAFAVHLDPVNMIDSPRAFYANAALLRDCFAQLGPYIKSCHAKDIALASRLTVHLDEVRPGLGGLDYATYLRELDRCDPELPLMLEHLPSEAEYDLAADHIRAVYRTL